MNVPALPVNMEAPAMMGRMATYVTALLLLAGRGHTVKKVSTCLGTSLSITINFLSFINPQRYTTRISVYVVTAWTNFMCMIE
jgi:hypothetical protein